MRRVLRVPRGEVDAFLDRANSLGIGEIEERDDLSTGTFEVFTEEEPEPDNSYEVAIEGLKGFNTKDATAKVTARAVGDIRTLLGIDADEVDAPKKDESKDKNE